MLLVIQAVQVLLLAVAVFVFFMVFGAVVIETRVIESWIGAEPTYPPGSRSCPTSRELVQVSLFLASFSGLYFTVSAVTDETYRRQFFSAVDARARAGRRGACGLPATRASADGHGA